MTKHNRFFCILLATTVVFVLLLSVACIAVEADHDCQGEDCPICQQISICENILKNLALAGSATAFGAVLLYILYKAIQSYTENLQKITLVSLKVELLD
ncbi:hypothetical protein [Acetivibrio ethanolgignens]|uniref:Uncharacterized protein n=1 Tax=Acetivibrio ethanolgignens TaxID=290052 RepID=A0A0V8QF82_9FIRM|nr:hypothetical protein [Acetivibrio ethanolgignens]KSV59207.1 hypothetical protein ASU35_10220 [Acetivibrio ethanolgignens]